MLKQLAIAACAGVLVAAPAAADEVSVKNAYLLCAFIDGTNLGSAPCEISGWNSSVTAVLDMSSGEARQLCAQIAGMMRDQGHRFQGGWTFQIKSPYSGGNSIAFCDL